MNPICVNCKIEMKCTKTGFLVAGTEVPNWVYNGDKYTCPKCGNEVVVNFTKGFESEFPADIYLKEGE